MSNNIIKRDEYLDFLVQKQKAHIESGFDISKKDLNKNLFTFQKFIVQRALRAGKYACFADCGLGKSLMQLECAYQTSKMTNKPSLILAPLAVVGQTVKEGVKFGIPVQRYDGSDYPVQITNYEQLENIDTSKFACIVLDESSILKNFEGKIKNDILDKFKLTPYKFAFTATPSPNDPMELGNHAEFLDVMSRNETLAMYFVHDGGETAKWRIKGHAVKIFYRFVGSWAIMLSKPHDIGFNTDGYELPKLNIIEEQIITDSRENGNLFNDVAVSATDFNKELRMTKTQRLDKAIQIALSKSNEPFIIWIKQNEEGEYLRKLLPDAIEVKGSDTPQYKEKHLLGFANNEFRILITKPEIASFGLNYQNCCNQIAASLDFSFERLYQCIRRSFRFGQKNEVFIYIITTDTMTNVIQSINLKQKKFEIMQEQMAEAVNVVLNENKVLLDETPTYDVETDFYNIKRGDCVQLIQSVPNESIGFSVFSPPFAELYTYSNLLEDMGNSKDYKEFLYQFSFLTKELFRVIKSGRNVAVHCMDLPIQKGKEGYIGLRDFSGMILRAFCGISEQERVLIDETRMIINECEGANDTSGLAYQMLKRWISDKEHDMKNHAGFIYHSRITIWKNPVVEMQRTKALGLLHKQIKKDSTMSRVGIPDYVMIFRKDGERLDPVTNTELSVDLWQKYASPVWMDINYGNTLQGYQDGREQDDEKHICPLQLDTIERLIHLYTNRGDTVLTPFMGIGSEVYQAVKMGRKGIGFELKRSYFDKAKSNIAAAVEQKKQVSLF
jgi:DNA modification methylase